MGVEMPWAPRAKATADALRLTKDERAALRRAGLTAGDLVGIDAGTVVAATYEEIDEERAEFLMRLASFVALGIGTNPAITLLERLGVRDLEDLATRDAAELFVANVEACAHTHPGIYDSFDRAIYLARCALDGLQPSADRYLPATWAREREAAGVDPMRFVWDARHAGADEPAPTSARLRLPTIGTTAPIFEGSTPAMEAIGQQDVVRSALPAWGGLTVFVGHWMWNGGYGAFARLDHLLVGDGVEAAGEWYAVASVEHVTGRDATISTNASPPPAGSDDVVLATSVHRRVGEIGMEDDVAPVERGSLRVVVHCTPVASKEDVDTARRPPKRPGVKNRPAAR